jgi:hypothetical protein
MKSRKKTKVHKPSPKKKSPTRRAANKRATAVSQHRAVEQQFIGDHPEAFEPYVGEYVVLEGASIVAHGPEPAIIVEQARATGIKVPLIIKVLPKLGPHQGYL